jgi:hypothetical protein
MPANLTNHTIAIAIIPFLAVLLLGLLFAFWIFMLMDPCAGISETAAPGSPGCW